MEPRPPVRPPTDSTATPRGLDFCSASVQDSAGGLRLRAASGSTPALPSQTARTAHFRIGSPPCGSCAASRGNVAAHGGRAGACRPTAAIKPGHDCRATGAPPVRVRLPSVALPGIRVMLLIQVKNAAEPRHDNELTTWLAEKYFTVPSGNFRAARYRRFGSFSCGCRAPEEYRASEGRLTILGMTEAMSSKEENHGG